MIMALHLYLYCIYTQIHAATPPQKLAIWPVVPFRSGKGSNFLMFVLYMFLWTLVEFKLSFIWKTPSRSRCVVSLAHTHTHGSIQLLFYCVCCLLYNFFWCPHCFCIWILLFYFMWRSLNSNTWIHKVTH